MHIINDMEAFLKHIEETVHTWFGNGRAAEEGKEALKVAILEYLKAPAEASIIVPVEVSSIEIPVVENKEGTEIKISKKGK